MAKLTAPSGAVVSVADGKVKALLRAGFSLIQPAAPAKKAPAKKAAPRKTSKPK